MKSRAGPPAGPAPTTSPAPAAGYSGTPLWKKLGLDDGQAILALGMPASVRASLPEALRMVNKGRGPWHAILQFATTVAELDKKLPEHLANLAPAQPKTRTTPARRAGFIWVAWPKKTPAKGLDKIDSDITEDRIRDVALPLGLVDIKVCAIDGQWSGLQLVIRKV